MDKKAKQFVILYNGCDEAADILLWPWTPRICSAVCSDSAQRCSLWAPVSIIKPCSLPLLFSDSQLWFSVSLSITMVLPSDSFLDCTSSDSLSIVYNYCPSTPTSCFAEWEGLRQNLEVGGKSVIKMYVTGEKVIKKEPRTTTQNDGRNLADEEYGKIDRYQAL